VRDKGSGRRQKAEENKEEIANKWNHLMGKMVISHVHLTPLSEKVDGMA
jgi:hypothetical protein